MLDPSSLGFYRQNPTAISLKAGCELFLRYTTRSLLELEQADIGTAKRRLIEVWAGMMKEGWEGSGTVSTSGAILLPVPAGLCFVIFEHIIAKPFEFHCGTSARWGSVTGHKGIHMCDSA